MGGSVRNLKPNMNFNQVQVCLGNWFIALDDSKCDLLMWWYWLD